MKTQAITNQSFSGKIVFVNRHFVNRPFDKISEYLPKQLGKEMETAIQKVKDKDFDVFVYRNRNEAEWFEVRADKDYRAKTGQKPVFVHENVIKSTFSDAVTSAIEAYQNVMKGVSA